MAALARALVLGLRPPRAFEEREVASVALATRSLLGGHEIVEVDDAHRHSVPVDLNPTRVGLREGQSGHLPQDVDADRRCTEEEELLGPE